ncbi:MAG TPA: [FeFe] hydrogenase H-cluster radical SAM maturase HydE [Ruminococcaceae bacterium]|nr:[FeFe] hydrogenase H-cluster radical SAM maturase HydE [Oscillospiraceae bacterium]
MNDLVNKLFETGDLSDNELKLLFENGSFNEPLARAADIRRRENYGDKVYIRGLIEFTNYCRNNCYYCGIRRDNKNAERYRLTKDEILLCCNEGYRLGFRTFVMQGGEDPYYTDEMICDIVSEIKRCYPDCAVTLSIGEKPRESYQAFFDAGADRYLLRHETADSIHYGRLHPEKMSLENRKRCLYDLKDIGYQVGSGFMVGSPYQTTENLISDLRFLQKLKPDMIGIGPYITHADTPFAGFKNGDVMLTLRLVSILRLMFPYVLIPSTTALGTIHPQGRELGLKAGANVVMPNLSPVSVRKLYSLYENKICTGEEAAQCRGCLERRVESAGYKIVTDIGNVRKIEE